MKLLHKNAFPAFFILLASCAFIFFPRSEHPPRVVFVADMHASVDAEDRDTRWGTTAFSRIKAIFKNNRTHPSHLVWLGDMIDFLPAEWDIAKQWIDWVALHAPETQQYAVMGNHEYIYYNYPEIQGQFQSRMPYEVSSRLIKPARAGQHRIFVKDTENFLSGRQILLIETPDYDTSNRSYIADITRINHSENSIELSKPVSFTFKAGKAEARQGFTESRGINAFLKTYRGTATKDTKSIFFIGNTCIILLSMDKFFDFDYEAKKTYAIPEKDFVWLEENIARHYKDHNIIIGTHEMPDSGKNLNNLHDPHDSIQYHVKTRKRLQEIAKKYHVIAWISAHTHPDARKDVVHTIKDGIHYFLVPSLGMGDEGQALLLEPVEGKNFLDFIYWSTDQNASIEKFRVPTSLEVTTQPSENK